MRTIVSLNPVMVDGTGMCGGCRVAVGGETLFACVDGPEFDGHLVDFDLLMDRLTTYREYEQEAKTRCDSGACKVGLRLGRMNASTCIIGFASALPQQALPEILAIMAQTPN